jgi:hypothetical protein
MVDCARYGLIATRAVSGYDCNEGRAVVMTVIEASARPRAQCALINLEIEDAMAGEESSGK